MLLGLDFDNTIIKYDEIFHRIACEKKLIPKDLPKEKKTIRDYLLKKNIENEWTKIQGEVYGDRIAEALPFDGTLESLQAIKVKRIPINIISHKTLEPYLGPKSNLHKAAMNWLKINNFCNPQGLDLKQKQVYFELTKEKKIDRILGLGCTHYVDDLPEILEMIPNSVIKIHFSPNSEPIQKGNWIYMKSWKELPAILS